MIYFDHPIGHEKFQKINLEIQVDSGRQSCYDSSHNNLLFVTDEDISDGLFQRESRFEDDQHAQRKYDLLRVPRQ